MSITGINDQILGLAYALKESVINYRNELPHNVTIKGTESPFIKSGYSIIKELITEATYHNPWFVSDHLVYAINLLATDLEMIASEEQEIPNGEGKKIAVLYRPAAPFEGLTELFHLVKHGYSTEVMPAADQQYLIKKFLLYLENFPGLSSNIALNAHKLTNFNSLISMSELGVTTKDYFEKYNSLQLHGKGTSFIMDGNEDDLQKNSIAEMICMYYGRSAQNIKVLFVPHDYDTDALTKALGAYSDQLFHNRYFNNFEYRKSAMIINHIPYDERGPLLVTESESQSGFTGVLCIQRYITVDDVLNNSLSTIYPPLNIENPPPDTVYPPLNTLPSPPNAKLHSFTSKSLTLSTFTGNKEKLNKFIQHISIHNR